MSCESNGLSSCNIRLERHLVCAYLSVCVSDIKSVSDSARTAGAKAVEAVVVLRSLLDNSKSAVNALENRIIHPSSDDDMTDLDTQLQHAREKQVSIATSLRRASSALGITQRSNLNDALQDGFVRLRMKAFQLKQQIRHRLRERKFELRHLEQSYRNAANGDKYHVLHIFNY